MKSRSRMGISLVMALVMVATAFVTIHYANAYAGNGGYDPNSRMHVDKKVWNGAAWVDYTEANIGDTVQFNISIKNTGNDDGMYLHHIVVNDTLPAGLDYVPGSYRIIADDEDHLDNGFTFIEGSNYLFWDFSPSHLWISNDSTAYILFNATVTDYGEQNNSVVVNSSWCGQEKNLSRIAWAIVNVPRPIPNISVNKTVSKDGCQFFKYLNVSKGDDVIFKIVVDNMSTDFDKVIVRDTLPNCLTYNDSASPREPDYIDGNDYYWNFTDPSFPITITFHAIADGCGECINQANVTGIIHGCKDTYLYDESSATVNISCPPSHPNITLTKEVSLDGVNWSKNVTAYLPDVVHAGNKIYFRLNVTNTGDVNLTGVLEDFLPPFLKYNYDSNVPVTYANDSYINWTATDSDPFEPGESVVITFTATPLSGGDGDNVAVATADQGVDATDSAHIILYEPRIVVEKKVKELCGDEWKESVEADYGDMVWFKIKLTYYGNPQNITEYAFHNITIVDILPYILSYVENTTTVSGDWPDWDNAFDPATQSEPNVAGNILTWDFDDIFWIPHGHSLTLVFMAEVTGKIGLFDCGNYTNLVNITGTECSGTNLEGNDTAEIEIPCPDFELDKKILDPSTGEWADSADVYPGRPFKFNITVTNTGSSTISLVVVDTLPDSVEYINATPTPDSIAGQVLTWYITLSAGEKAYIIIEVRATECYGCYNNTANAYFDCYGQPKYDNASFCIVNDGNAPESQVDEISSYWHNAPFTVTATANDDESGVGSVKLYYSYSADNSTWGAWTYFGKDTDGSDGWSWLFSGADGYYHFYSIAIDMVGNVEPAPVMYDAEAGIDTVPPESHVDSIVPYVQESLPVHLSVIAADALSGIKDYSIYYRYSEDNSTWGAWMPADPAFNAPNGSGYYQFYSIAEDVAGNVESAPSGYDAQCKVEIPEPLTAIIESITHDGDGKVGDTFHFYGNATGGVPPYTYKWFFGDGDNSTGKNVDHVYDTACDYTVRLMVIDSEGHTDNATQEIVVGAIPGLQVKITKPVKGGVYFRDKELFVLPFNISIIIGPITIEANVTNATGSAQVEFLINNDSKATDSTEPYNYTYDEKSIGFYTIKAIAKDSANRTAEDSVSALIINLKRTVSNETKPGILKGKVYINGTILKKGIAGAKVTVLETGDNTTTGKWLWKKGKYSLSLPPGNYTLKVEAEGYATKVISGVQIVSGKTTKLNIALDKLTNETKPGTLAGKVYINGTKLKKGIAGAKVTVLETGDNTTTSSHFWNKGKYSLSLPPGNYTVRIEAEGYETVEISGVVISSGETTKLDVPMDKATEE